MKTTLIENKGLSEFDGLLLTRLKLLSVSHNVLKDQSMRLGVRNEYNLIYREIGVTSLIDLLKIIDTFESMGFIDELGRTYSPIDGYDAIFNPGSLN